MDECSHNDQPQSEQEACLFCSLMKTVRSATEKHSAFYTHMFNARIEVLQAFRSLIDQRISVLEKKKSSPDRKKATQIEVE